MKTMLIVLFSAGMLASAFVTVEAIINLYFLIKNNRQQKGE